LNSHDFGFGSLGFGADCLFFDSRAPLKAHPAIIFTVRIILGARGAYFFRRDLQTMRLTPQAFDRLANGDPAKPIREISLAQESSRSVSRFRFGMRAAPPDKELGGLDS
jgi:hypothetical protein